MPRGGARPNSGPKPRSLHSRALTNARIQRPTDVPPPPGNVFAMPSAPLQQDAIDGEWKPSAADLRSLGRTGKAFLATWLRVHVLNAKEGVIALAAARCRDDADRWRKRSRTKTPQAARFARLALEAEKHFAFLLGQLRVTS